MADPVVVVLAHGLGLRLAGVTGGRNKALCDLGAPGTILSNLVVGLRAAGTTPIVTRRADDDELRRAADDLGLECILMEPSGYVVDLVALTAQNGDLISVESDIVARPVVVARTIEALLASSADVAFGVASWPSSTDPRTIRPLVHRRRLVSLTSSTSSPGLSGMYRFGPAASADLARFTAGRSGTFHDFMDQAVGASRRVELVDMGEAVNTNWPEDLLLARSWARGWSDSAAQIQAGP